MGEKNYFLLARIRQFQRQIDRSDLFLWIVEPRPLEEMWMLCLTSILESLQ